MIFEAVSSWRRCLKKERIVVYVTAERGTRSVAWGSPLRTNRYVTTAITSSYCLHALMEMLIWLISVYFDEISCPRFLFFFLFLCLSWCAPQLPPGRSFFFDCGHHNRLQIVKSEVFIMGCFSLSTLLSWASFGLKLENTGLSGRQPGDSTGLKTKT